MSNEAIKRILAYKGYFCGNSVFYADKQYSKKFEISTLKIKKVFQQLWI